MSSEGHSNSDEQCCERDHDHDGNCDRHPGWKDIPEEFVKVPPPDCGKTFRGTDTEGVKEKVFVDHTAKPPRAYPTGELYKLVGKAEGEDGAASKALDGLLAEMGDVETVIIFDPADFVPYLYVRVGGLQEGLVFPDKTKAPYPQPE